MEYFWLRLKTHSYSLHSSLLVISERVKGKNCLASDFGKLFRTGPPLSFLEMEALILFSHR